MLFSYLTFLPCVLFSHTDTFTFTHVGKLASTEVLFMPSGIRNRAFKSVLQ